MLESKLVKEAYLRILPVQILTLVVSAVNSFVDGLITARFIGTRAMAAIGFFAPVSTVIGISYVICVGIQILCSKYMGSGEKKSCVRLFSGGIVFLSAFSVLVSLFCITFKAPLSLLLGASDETAVMLQDYITGYSYGIIGQVMSGTLMMFLPMNNGIKRSYAAITAMIVTNITLDMLFVTVMDMGVFGMGLATSVSFLVSTSIMVSGFFNRNKVLYISLKDISFRMLPNAAYLGIPSLMFTLGCTAKSFILNRTLMHAVGYAAVAAMNVQNSVCSLLGSIPAGCANAFIILGSLYYGEQDRRSLTALMRYSLRIGVIISAAVTVLTAASSVPIASFFYSVSDKAWAVTQRMLLLFPSFLILNTLFNLLMKVYQCQQKMSLVNILSVSENIVIAALSACFTPVIGTDAVWLSFPAGEIICLVIVAVSVFIRAKKPTFRLEDWMKLDKDFGFGSDECLDFTVSSPQEVVNVSEKVMDFCLSKGIDNKRAMYSGLCIEEMAGNTVEYGFGDGKKHNVDIRVVVKDGLTLRIRDDCREFDPQRRLDQYKEDKDVTRNIGIRLVANIASEMTYRPSAGINTILMKI